MGRVIAVCSGKGGVGKTTLCCYLSEYLTLLGRSCVALDGDMELRNLDIGFGVADSVVFDVSDLIAGRCSLDKALIRTKAGPFYLPAADELPEAGRRLAPTVAVLKQHFDYVVVDCPAGVSGLTIDLALLSDEIIVVTEPTEYAVRDAEKMALKLQKIGKQQLRLVVNRVRKKMIESGLAPDIDRIIDSVAVRLVGLVPYDRRIIELQNKGLPLAASDLSGVKRQIADICGRLEGRQIPLRRI